ncbi:hypothetical protein JL720_8921 [Aureococcus anophagefferens]|nr:hypothetical protein JL720_8921 [Aureococcus anophagefferens]
MKTSALLVALVYGSEALKPKADVGVATTFQGIFRGDGPSKSVGEALKRLKAVPRGGAVGVLEGELGSEYGFLEEEEEEEPPVAPKKKFFFF